MANPKDCFPDNAPGLWYVDAQCICCSLCEDAAPNVFRMSYDGSHHFVFQQPATIDDVRDAENARDRCPVEAIGRDRISTPPVAAESTFLPS